MANPDIALIFTPLILSLFTSYFTGKVSSKVWFQPPGFVFMIVWTALYIMLGFILYESKEKENYTCLGLVIGALFLTYLWQYFYNYKKYYKVAIFIIFLTLLISLELLAEIILEDWDRVFIYTYIPFVAWLIFALVLASHNKKTN